MRPLEITSAIPITFYILQALGGRPASPYPEVVPFKQIPCIICAMNLNPLPLVLRSPVSPREHQSSRSG